MARIGAMKLERIVERALLLRPARVEARLAVLRAAGRAEVVPNTWQITLGVLRMLHRVAFRSQTIGMSRNEPVRTSFRARLFAARPLRAPFLLSERAIAPLDLSGLLSSPERIVRHLLGAHHDGNQFAYDLQMIAADPGMLEETLRRARDVVTGRDARSAFLRDLVVYDGYHERLVEACERALRGDFGLDAEAARNPDVSFDAYLAWCAHQPATLEETLSLLARGLYDPMRGRLDAPMETTALA